MRYQNILTYLKVVSIGAYLSYTGRNWHTGFLGLAVLAVLRLAMPAMTDDGPLVPDADNTLRCGPHYRPLCTAPVD